MPERGGMEEAQIIEIIESLKISILPSLPFLLHVVVLSPFLLHLLKIYLNPKLILVTTLHYTIDNIAEK